MEEPQLMTTFPICLIGGSGRSGTTILAKCLLQHPKMCNVPESRYLVDPGGILDFYTSTTEWSPFASSVQIRRLESVLRNVTRDTLLNKFLAHMTYPFRNKIIKLRGRYYGIRMQKHCPNFDNLSKSLISQLGKVKFRGEWIGLHGLCKKQMKYMRLEDSNNLRKTLSIYLLEVFSSTIKHQNASYYLEKNTWNHLFMHRILELLPEAKLVYIQRDPRDVVASFCKQTWMPSCPIQSSMVLRDLIIRWGEVKDNIPDSSFLEISLEALVGQSEDTLRHVCNFYGIEWSESLLTLDLSRSNTGRWKKQLTANQQTAVQDILQQQINDGGYG